MIRLSIRKYTKLKKKLKKLLSLIRFYTILLKGCTCLIYQIGLVILYLSFFFFYLANRTPDHIETLDNTTVV